MRNLAVLILSAVLVGCATAPTNNDAVNVLIEEAAKASVRHYFADHQNEAERVQRFREVAQVLLDNEGLTTVGQFEAIAIAELSKTTDPLKREDAIGLVKSLAAIFKQYVGAGVLDSEQAVRVKGVIAALVAALPAG